MSSDKIIFAFDFSTEFDQDPTYLKKLEPFAKMLEYVGMVKIGMELFYSTNGEILSMFDPERVFLDLKLHDIPETVGRATRALCKKYQPKFLSVHLSEPKSFRQAVEAAAEFGTKIIGISVLTSMSDQNCMDMFGRWPHDQVDWMVTEPDEHPGLGGFVCSGKEVLLVRHWWHDAVIIAPGVRSKSVPKNDQRRVVTPADAIKSGANYVVVGREIRDAENPFEAAQRIAKDIEESNRDDQ